LITLSIDNQKISVAEGTTIAVAILSAGIDKFRSSVTGEPRGPLCVMGICFECRVTINGERHQTSCTRLVEEGMKIVTESEPPA
jgi:sarcosine oxidase subunit alpha